MPDQTKDRRSHPRVPLRLPVKLFNGSDEPFAEGHTINISHRGLLVKGPEVHRLARHNDVRVQLSLDPACIDQTRNVFELGADVRHMAESSPSLCGLQLEEIPPPPLFAPELIGAHQSIAALKQKLLDILDYDVNVLLQGESGVGKTIVAEMIHRYSCRSDGPLVRVNCPSIPASVLESHLFGHTKGAFTDARSPKPGLFRAADGGTLVLDEISAIPCHLQAKLLRAIEEKSFIPVGASEPVKADVRVIGTTNDHLQQKIRDGELRQDLFFRINEFPITVPPLRERVSDVPLLASHFHHKYCIEFGKQTTPPAPEEMDALRRYSWPGNVRELENVIKRRVLTDSLPHQQLTAGGGEDGFPQGNDCLDGTSEGELRTLEEIDQLAEQAEKRAISLALKLTHYKRNEAADLLDVSYRTLLRKLNKYEIET